MKTTTHKPGERVKVRGFDMRCKHTIELVSFVRYLTGNAHFDCVVESRSGVKVMSDSSKFVR